MSKHILTAKILVASGVLFLTKAQAADRPGSLKELSKGKYEVLKLIEFKAGEELGFEGGLPKVYLNSVEGGDELAAELSGGEASKQKPAAKSKPAADDKPSIAELKKSLDALGVGYEAKAKQDDLIALLDYAKKAIAKAIELSGKTAEEFAALPEADRVKFLEEADAALSSK